MVINDYRAYFADLFNGVSDLSLVDAIEGKAQTALVESATDKRDELIKRKENKPCTDAAYATRSAVHVTR